MKKLLGLMIVVSLVFFSCDQGTDSDSDNDGGQTTDVFELIGTWEASNVEVGPGVLAELTTTFTQDSYSGTTEIVSPEEAADTYESTGDIVSFNNEEGWYIARIATADDDSVIGKYGRTDYTLADDGQSFTGISYSYEDTEEDARESDTVQIAEMTCTKQ